MSRGHETSAAEDGQVLAHVRNLAADPNGQVADGELAFREGLQDAQSLGIGQGPTDGRESLPFVIDPINSLRPGGPDARTTGNVP